MTQESVFSNLGQRNFLRTEIVYPLRGDLLDCNGVLLAANRPVFNLYWHGSGLGKFTEKQVDVLNKIQSILNLDLGQCEKLKAIEYVEKYSRRTLIKGDISFEQLCQISEQCADSPNLVVENCFNRIYPHKNLASHVLGYLSRTDKIGNAGVEKAFEDKLQGQTGCILNIINSTGKTLSQKVYRQPKAGVDVKLTLDFEIQQLAENLFSEDQSGAFLLMDPENGAVKALVSFPNFDPNLFLGPITEDEWQNKLSVNSPLLNRVTCAMCPPGSTFKLVTMSAGLEEKLIEQHSDFFCCGYSEFCGRRYYCMHHEGHGQLTLKNAIAKSCNIPCFQIAKRIKIDTLASYAYKFGLGRKTNFLLPEKAGLVPTIAWKKAAKKESWWKGETLSVSIGQGYLMVTPMQTCRMVSAVCTGYLVKPRILETEKVEKENLNISTHTLNILREAMREVVLSGTVHILSYIKGFEVYAKTGTAQTCSLSKEVTSKKQLEHAWVTGYFRYNGGKPLAFVFLVENTGSSHFALVLADKFLRAYKQMLDLRGKPVAADVKIGCDKPSIVAKDASLKDITKVITEHEDCKACHEHESFKDDHVVATSNENIDPAQASSCNEVETNGLVTQIQESSEPPVTEHSTEVIVDEGSVK